MVEKISIKVVEVVKKLTRVFSVVFFTALPEDNMAILNNMDTLNRGIHRNMGTLLNRGTHRSRVDILHKGTRQLGMRRSRVDILLKGTRPPLTAVIPEEAAMEWGEF